MVVQYGDGEVEFRFFRPQAEQAFLVGDFSGWRETCLPMVRTASGWWLYRLRLAEGVYQFKYLADGAWYEDHAAFGRERGPFGWNSVVVVEGRVPASVHAA